MKFLRSALILASLSYSSAFTWRPLSSKTRFDSRAGLLSPSDINTMLEQTGTKTKEKSPPCTTITAPTNFYKPSNLHKIHIQPFLSKEEANKCLELANDYATKTKSWQGFEVIDSVELSSYLVSVGFLDRVKERLADAYDLHPNDVQAMDFFCAQYEAKSKTSGDGGDGDEEKLTMDHLRYHRNKSLLSFTVLLSEPTDFEGGGTIFDCLAEDPANPSGITIKYNSEKNEIQEEDILERRLEGGIIKSQNKGDCLLYPGKMLHGTDKVTSGKQIEFVGFVQVASDVQAPGAMRRACQEWGRMDVAKLRAKHQLKQMKLNEEKGEGKLNGWKTTRNEKWLPQGKSRSSRIKGFAPFFSTVMKRSELGYQRQQRLMTEETLLHKAVLPKEVKPVFFEADKAVLEPVVEPIIEPVVDVPDLNQTSSLNEVVLPEKDEEVTLENDVEDVAMQNSTEVNAKDSIEAPKIESDEEKQVEEEKIEIDKKVGENATVKAEVEDSITDEAEQLPQETSTVPEVSNKMSEEQSEVSEKAENIVEDAEEESSNKDTEADETETDVVYDKSLLEKKQREETDRLSALIKEEDKARKEREAEAQRKREEVEALTRYMREKEKERIEEEARAREIEKKAKEREEGEALARSKREKEQKQIQEAIKAASQAEPKIDPVKPEPVKTEPVKTTPISNSPVKTVSGNTVPPKVTRLSKVPMAQKIDEKIEKVVDNLPARDTEDKEEKKVSIFKKKRTKVVAAIVISLVLGRALL